ncbi:hypothetical protein M885DRAFT_531578 [Pelagophyceae sp. CCMP2097]|nr:hypothetical protein M885DRAFT_531578 [Pelagophyceae sp. CCMP2097]
MNITQRYSIAARQAFKHKSLGFGSKGETEEKDEVLEKALERFTAHELRVVKLAALTVDARAQLGEAFLQLGRASQCFCELGAPELDVAASGTALGLPMPEGAPPSTLEARAMRSRVVSAMLQEAFHASFGEALQEALLSPLEAEIAAFVETKKQIVLHHEAAAEAKHYRDKLTSINKDKEKDKFNEKLHRNTDKSNEAAAALAEKRKLLDSLLRGNENERKALLTRHVSELKGMLHRFCERALSALGCSHEDVLRRAGSVELDRYNIYGDVNVESAMSKMSRGAGSLGSTAAKSGDSVAMRLAHMKRHAATTFTTTAKSEEAETISPLELFVNEMASRYEKAWTIVLQLQAVLKELNVWYESGFLALTALADELHLASFDDDQQDTKMPSLVFHATIEAVAGMLRKTVVDRCICEVLGPLEAATAEYVELPARLRTRRAKALERQHYDRKVIALTLQQMKDMDKGDKLTDKAKEAAAERMARNRQKASEAEEESRGETSECKTRLLAFDAMFKSRSDATANSLDSLQREFYLAFAAKVASNLSLDAQSGFVSQADVDAAAKLSSLMAKGLVVPQAGLTANVLATRQFSELRLAGEAQVQMAEQQAPQMGLAGAVRDESQEASRPAPPVLPVAQEYDPTDLAGRKEALSPSEADAVREMMKSGVGQAQAVAAVMAPQDALPPPVAAVAAAPVAAPPPVPLAPGMVLVKAVFDFAEVQQGDLGFLAGDLITTDAAAFAAAGESGGWINGEIGGKTGAFPSNYVTAL